MRYAKAWLKFHFAENFGMWFNKNDFLKIEVRNNHFFLLFLKLKIEDLYLCKKIIS